MARRIEDEIEDKVRARLQERLVSAGVDQGRVALEVLYWLPAEFVRAYQELYLRALHLGDGDDGEKAGEDEGRIKAQVKSSKRGKAGSMAAQGGGKKYKLEWVVKDEQALEIKARVDRRLKGIVDAVGLQVRGSRDSGKERVMGWGESRGNGGGVEYLSGAQSHGSTPGGMVGELVEMKNGKKRCRDCGKIASDDWARCPYPHA